MIFKKNKKATDKILSIYWFTILVIVTGSIIAMVSTFYNHPYDVRDIEANILSNKVADCLSDGGEMSSRLFNDENELLDNFSIVSECPLNFDVEKDLDNEQGNYYLELNFRNLNRELVSSFSNGNFAFKADCMLGGEKKKYKRLVVCSNRSFYSISPSGEAYSINILSIVRKTEKNVK